MLTVVFRCKDENMMLDDNSGRAVFELYCNITDPDHPKMEEASNWPSCVASQLCTVIPDPDTDAASSGMVRDVADTRVSLLPGEFVIYNCTDPTKPVTNTGAYNMMIKVLPGRTDPQLPKKGNITAKVMMMIIEELVKCEVENTFLNNFSFSV